MRQFIGERALVLGGSIGGLLAARALADSFQQVTILERDSLIDAPQQRKGTPQARHTHGLLARGLEVIEQMLPGTCSELVRHEVEHVDIVGNCLWHVEGGYHRQFASGLVGTGQSRALLEWIVRGRVARLPNVQLRDQVTVQRLFVDPPRERVVGVEAVDRRTGKAEAIDADLIVDATGRGSRLPAWLRELGFSAPEEERVEVDLAYATRLFRRRPSDFGGNRGVVQALTPPNRRFAAVIAQEGQQWSLTMGGLLGDHPSTDEAEFMEFARGLPAPEIYNFLRTAEPLSDIVAYRFPASLRRRYEKLRRMPDGVLPLGDAIASFNPVYGQGMTVAARQAQVLGDCLAEGREGLCRKYLARAATYVESAWQISVGSDLRFSGVRGRRSLWSRPINAYLARVHKAAHRDEEVARAFHRVANFFAPPSSLFRPSLMKRVLWPKAERTSPIPRMSAHPIRFGTMMGAESDG